MRGKARLLCALLLVLLCVAARLQGAWCRGGGGGGHGGGGGGGGGHGGGEGGGGGHGGGEGGGGGHGGGEGEGGGTGGGGSGRGDDGPSWRGGGFIPGPHGRSAAAEPRCRDGWRVYGAAAGFAAAALVWWL